MPKRKRVQRDHTEDWQTIQHYTLWPEQTAYELLRPIVQDARSRWKTCAGDRSRREAFPDLGEDS